MHFIISNPVKVCDFTVFVIFFFIFLFPSMVSAAFLFLFHLSSGALEMYQASVFTDSAEHCEALPN